MKPTQRAVNERCRKGAPDDASLLSSGWRWHWRSSAPARPGLRRRFQVLWSAGGSTPGRPEPRWRGSHPTRAATSRSSLGRRSGVISPSVVCTPGRRAPWRRTISPSIGTFTGDWVAAASNGDILAVGHNVPPAAARSRSRWFGTRPTARSGGASTLPARCRRLGGSWWTRRGAYLAFNSAGTPGHPALHSSAGALRGHRCSPRLHGQRRRHVAGAEPRRDGRRAHGEHRRRCDLDHATYNARPAPGAGW